MHFNMPDICDSEYDTAFTNQLTITGCNPLKIAQNVMHRLSCDEEQLMKAAFPSVSSPLAPINAMQDYFPVNRIFCVGRNYVAHAREMGKDPEREPPFFFMKQAAAYVPSDTTIAYPPGTDNYHYETELVLAIGKAGRNISASSANRHIFGYAVGLDMTRRDLQLQAREQGRPWDLGKNFPESMPLGPIHPIEQVSAIAESRIWLELNGTVCQDAHIKDMIWSPEEIVEQLSQFYALEPGDLIMTGTPAGVGAVAPGDTLSAHIEGLTSLDVAIGKP